jgi:hypothetical protein
MNSIHSNIPPGAAAPSFDSRQTPGAEITGEGPIKLLCLPAEWTLDDCFSVGDELALKSFRCGDPAAELRILTRTVSDTNSFLAAITEPLRDGLRIISPGEVRALKTILGTTVGDNQYTNPNPKESRCAPSCHIIFARVAEIALRRLIIVEGIFVERNGKAGNRFVDYYVAHSATVHEILLQAPIDRFDLLSRGLKQSMDNIQWHQSD